MKADDADRTLSNKWTRYYWKYGTNAYKNGINTTNHDNYRTSTATSRNGAPEKHVPSGWVGPCKRLTMRLGIDVFVNRNIELYSHFVGLRLAMGRCILYRLCHWYPCVCVRASTLQTKAIHPSERMLDWCWCVYYTVSVRFTSRLDSYKYNQMNVNMLSTVLHILARPNTIIIKR